MANFQLEVYASDTSLAQSVARRWLEAIADANSKGQPYLVALSGGRITKALFSAAVQLAKQKAVDLENVHFFWADERCVPPTDPESNFSLADQLLFQPLAIHPRQIHRLRGEADPQVAVESAIFELNSLANKTPTGQPQFDLILLGMGEDGHVASLFPNASAEVITCRAPYLWIDNSPKPPPKRISLSYATISTAKDVWVLVSGAGKEYALKESTRPQGKTPLARVLELRSESKIFSTITNLD